MAAMLVEYRYDPLVSELTFRVTLSSGEVRYLPPFSDVTSQGMADRMAADFIEMLAALGMAVTKA